MEKFLYLNSKVLDKKLKQNGFGEVELVTNNWGSSHMVGGAISIL